MGNYFNRRIISLIPICFLLIACTFLLTRSMPGDALDQLLMKSEGVSVSSSDYQNRKEKLAKQIGLDKPLFYFSVSTLAEANAFRYFNDPNEKNAFYLLLNTYGDYQSVCNYFDAIKNTEDACVLAVSYGVNRDVINAALVQMRALKTETDEKGIQKKILLMNDYLKTLKVFSAFPDYINNLFLLLKQNKKGWKKYVPAINFYKDNQFHAWFFGDEKNKGIAEGNLGTSYFTGKSVITILKEKTGWSILLAMSSVVVAYLTGIPLAAWLVYRKNKKINLFFDLLAGLFYATPVYLMGVALLFFFSNPDLLNILPSSGVKPIGGFLPGTSFADKTAITISHLLLPFICYTYATFAFLLKATKGLLDDQMKAGYIKTAFAKGLHSRSIVFKHALKNAILPLLAVFTNVFPALLGGSVIIETLFSIPGIGLEIFNAAVGRNFPVIAAVFLLTGILSLIGFILSDFITSRMDPRISFDNRK